VFVARPRRVEDDERASGSVATLPAETSARRPRPGNLVDLNRSPDPSREVVIRIAAMKANRSARIDLKRINRTIGSFDVQELLAAFDRSESVP
jgi:hypothetical protein